MFSCFKPFKADLTSQVHYTHFLLNLLCCFSGKQASFKNDFNDSSFNHISLSSINRRDIFGQTLLHRAVIKEDLDLICAVIKSGAIVNAKDYAGKLCF